MNYLLAYMHDDYLRELADYFAAPSNQLGADQRHGSAASGMARAADPLYFGSTINPDAVSGMKGTIRKPLETLVFVSIWGVVLAHSANAGLFSTALSDENVKALQRIGISSSLGHTLQGQQVGLTVFGNRHFEVDLPDWTLDADVRKQLMEEIPASGRVTAALEPWDGAPTGNYKATLAAAREKGFDAVLIIETTDNPNDRLLPAGPSLLHKKALGLDRVHVCNSMRADMYRVADGKRIGFDIPDPCDYTKSLPPAQAWHENWADYSDDDKRLVLEEVSAQVRKQIDRVLATLNLQRH